jgi:hypothetical protein
MKLGAETAQITPTPGGWRLHLGSAAPKEAATLEEIAALLPPGGHVELSLPCQAAVLERLTLPSTEREELQGMIQLHLEKTLPYPVEEVTSDFEEIQRTETESTVLALAVQIALVSAVGFAAYALAAHVLRITELPSIVGIMADLLRRPRRA